MKEKWILPLLLGLFFALSRWPGLMPWGLSAAYGLFFCAGVFSRRFPIWIPFSVLLVTDLLLNTLYYETAPLGGYMLVSYLAFAGIVALAKVFRRDQAWWKLAGGGVLAALLFYLVTNTVSWLSNPAYAKTIAGWIQSLTVGEMGWPATWTFFRNTLLGGGLFAGLFAAILQSAEASEPATDEQPATEEAGEGEGSGEATESEADVDAEPERA